MLATAASAEAPRPASLPEDIFPSLQRILQQALAQSPTMLQKNLELAQAEAVRYLNSSALYPNVGSSVSYSVNTSSPTEANGVSSRADGLYYSLNVYQPIFHWGVLKAQADSSKIGVKISEENFAEAYRNLALSIRSQFLSLIVLKLKQQNAAFALKVAKDTLALNEERLRKGAASQGEIIPIRLAVDDAGLQLDQAVMEFDYARNFLAQTAGLTSLDADEIPDEIPAGSLRYDGGALQDEVRRFKQVGVENTNTALTYQLSVDQANLNYKVQKYRLYPKLGLSAGISQSNSTYATPTSVTQAGLYSQNVSLTVSWSIFDGFATKGAKLSALSARRVSERTLQTYLEQTRLQADRQNQLVAIAYRGMRINEVRRDLARGALDKASDDLNRGFSSQGAVDRVRVSFNNQDLAATVTRMEFLNRSAELLSLIGADPLAAKQPPAFKK